MARIHSLSFVLLLGLVPVAGSWVAAAEKEEGRYVRLRENGKQEPIALETSIVRFESSDENRKGLAVDLIGAIHIADKSYYDELNRRFRDYDAVLYELVAPEEANAPRPGQRSGSVIGGMQVGMKSLLDLAFQLDHIDYRAKNMVHADLTAEEFDATMKRRNESFAGMFFRMMGQAFAEQAKDPLASSDLQLLAAMMAPDRAYQLKLVLSKEFADLEGQTDILDGPEGSTIITERNKRALEVLSREIDNGRKKIAIFYGAGHLKDFQRRLEEDFKMKVVRTDWVSAWSLVRAEPAASSPDSTPASTTPK